MNNTIKKYYEILTVNTINSMKERGIHAFLVYSGEEAVKKVVEIIPPGSDVMTGGSTTLQEIGLISTLESGKYNFLRKKILEESEPNKRRAMRRRALTCDYFLGSANAIASTGEIVCIDHGGSRVSAYAAAANHVIIVTGVNKITFTLEEALTRAKNFATPLESLRTGESFPYGSLGKTLIIEEEAIEGRMIVIFIMGTFGF